MKRYRDLSRPDDGDPNKTPHPEFTRAEGAPRSIPAAVLEDRARRVLADKTLTASIFGDPAPGQSALDKKRAAAHEQAFRSQAQITLPTERVH